MDARRSQPCGELGAVVDPSIENETQGSALIEQRLLLAERLRRRARDAMSKADRPVRPASLAVRAAVSDRLGEPPEKRDVDRPTVQTAHTGETAHDGRSGGTRAAGAGREAGQGTSAAER